jgi:glycosyltransferase involved in cell wall biosynthesis
MERLFSPICHRMFGKKGANRALLRTCINIEPDILLLVHGNQIFSHTLADIRRAVPNITIIFFWGDAIWDNAPNLDLIHEKLPYLDSVFITTGGEWLVPYAGQNRIVAYIPNPVEVSIDRGRAFETEQTEYDLIFFGSDDPDRTPILQTIKERLPDLKIGFFGCLGNPFVFGIEKEKITFRSKMALNLTRRNDVLLCSSNRLADTTANGVLTFCDQDSGLQPLYRENEVVYYNGIDDLISKIQYYNENDEERIKIARAGWKRAHDAFSAQRILKFMIDATFRKKDYTDIPWPRFILEDGKKVCWDDHLISCQKNSKPS